MIAATGSSTPFYGQLGTDVLPKNAAPGSLMEKRGDTARRSPLSARDNGFFNSQLARDLESTGYGLHNPSGQTCTQQQPLLGSSQLSSISRVEIEDVSSLTKANPLGGTSKLRKLAKKTVDAQQQPTIILSQESSSDLDINALDEKMSSLQRTTVELPAGQIDLKYRSVEDARARLVKPRVTSSPAADLEAFKADRLNVVWRIMRAIDSHRCLKPQSKASRELTTNERAKWEKWQKDAHDRTLKNFEKDARREHLEAQSWEIYESIRVFHEYGPPEDLERDDGITSCLERADAVVKCLKEFAIARQRAMTGMNIDQFVANPAEYAKKKVASLWNTDRKRDKQNGSTDAAAGKKRTQAEALTEEQEDVEISTEQLQERDPRIRTSLGP